MEIVIGWLISYSLPVVLLLIFGASLIYVLQVVTEKSISSALDRYTKEIELRLERRSEFEQRVLIDRYTLVKELSTRLESVLTNIRRSHGGHPVPEGFFVEGPGFRDIAPLTEIFQDLVVHHVVMTDSFYQHLRKMADGALKFANAQSKSEAESVVSEIMKGREAFQSEFNQHFGIDRISPK